MSIESLRRSIRQARGLDPADLVLSGGRFLDLATGELRDGDIAICGDRIAGTMARYEGVRTLDITGRIVVPGFIDTHLHVESSLVTPLEFERCILPHGVTTAICDPHEIANILGAEGIQYFLDAAERTILDLRVQLSSCVPATHLETSGARLDLEQLAPFAAHPKVIGLAEMMNFPGVLAGAPDLLEKLEAFEGRHIDGHAPLLRGTDLNGYLVTGIRTEHEATTASEALEKLAKGMTILIREGSVSKDLHALIPLITERHSAFLAFCTDDRNPLDIAEEGHIDHMIRTAIASGAAPLDVYRVSSISAARAFGLFDRGMVAPGWRADLVILDDLAGCAISAVISAGRLVDDALFGTRAVLAPIGLQSVKTRQVTAVDFQTPPSSAVGETSVIGVTAGRIITEHRRMLLPVRHGRPTADLAQDILKVAVVERHGLNGNVAVGFVQGFGLQRGAIASSVGHDSHNVCVVGADEDDMAAAVNRLGALQGGFVVVEAGKVIAELALPVAGLMSLDPFETVRDGLVELRRAAWGLGVTVPEPFLQIAFLPLPVIPHLKITDRGLVDVDRFTLVER